MRKREKSFCQTPSPTRKSDGNAPMDHLWLTGNDNTSLKILTNDFICCLKQLIKKANKSIRSIRNMNNMNEPKIGYAIAFLLHL